MEEITPKGPKPGTLSMVLSTVEWLGGAAFLGAWTLAIGGGYFAEYLHVFAISFSVTSIAALGSLPMLTALVLAFIAVMALYLLLPSIPLWVTLEGRCLLDGHQPIRRAERAQNPLTSPDLSRRWVFVHGLFGIILAGLIVIGALAPGANDARLFAVTLIAAMVASAVAFEPARRRADIKGASAAGFYCLMTFSIWAQSSLFILALRTVLSLVPDSTLKSVWTSLVAVVWFCCLIPLIQFEFAVRIKAGWTADMLKGAVLALLVLAAIPLMAPPVPARVIAVALQKKGKDGKPCVVLVASAKADIKDWVGISVGPTKAPERSVSLAFASLVDATWYVKRTLDGPTFPVPKEQVSDVDGCPPPPAPVAPANAVPPAAAAATGAPWQGWGYIGVAGFVVSLFSLWFAMRTYRDICRPLVTARVTAHPGRNLTTALRVLVENTGTHSCPGQRPDDDEGFVLARHQLPVEGRDPVARHGRVPGPRRTPLRGMLRVAARA